MKRRLKGEVRVTAKGTATAVVVGWHYFDLPKPVDLDLRKRVKSSFNAAIKSAQDRAQLRFEREWKREEKLRRDLAKAARAERDRRSTIHLPDRSNDTI